MSAYSSGQTLARARVVPAPDVRRFFPSGPSCGVWSSVGGRGGFSVEAKQLERRNLEEASWQPAKSN